MYRNFMLIVLGINLYISLAVGVTDFDVPVMFPTLYTNVFPSVLYNAKLIVAPDGLVHFIVCALPIFTSGASVNLAIS